MLIHRVRASVKQIRLAQNHAFDGKKPDQFFGAECQCCKNRFWSEFVAGIDDICPYCGWEQQFDSSDYTGQNPMSLAGYRRLYKLLSKGGNSNG